MICQYLDCSEEFTPSKHGVSKYCSTSCRSKANRAKYGKAAKELKCVTCGELFKRVCAKDNRCKRCKTNISFGKAIDKDSYPKLDRDTELSMIEDFLKEKKLKEIN